MKLTSFAMISRLMSTPSDVADLALPGLFAGQAAGHVVGDDSYNWLASSPRGGSWRDALEADSHACIAISTTTNDSDRTPASPRRTPPLDHCGQVSPCR